MSQRQLLVRPDPLVAAMAPYTGAPPDPLIEVKLDSNESAAAVPPLDRPHDGWQPNRYMRTAALESAIAGRFGIEPARVLVTAGADDALERSMRVVCRPGRQAILTVPTFEVLERYARLAGAETVFVPWWTGDFPTVEVCAAATGDPAVVAVVSPNNPTGAVASATALAELADRLPTALIVLDHAYVEYAEAGDDLTRTALGFPNVVVLRTFSKAWSGAGLRVGYAVGDPRVLRWLRTLGQPYPVAAPSVAMVLELLAANPEPPRYRIERVRRERERLVRLLDELGIETLPSRANFVLARVGDPAWVRRALVSLGVGVRPFPGRPGLEEHLRFTVPEDDVAADRLHHALETVISPAALLFDLDGVIADVGGSYRAAMQRTAAEYGVTISAADIALAKARGNANNDWLLTQIMLRERGVEVDLDELGARFEAWYQGCDDRPGLYQQERSLIDRARLEKLGGGRPLGLVTGRPLADARRFLDRHRLDGLFAALVTMEDGPAKPDPQPVRLALERLGVRTAWMVGDTPDDVRAARAAGVLPIGCRAPGEAAVADSVLEQSGAARVLGSIVELEGVLP